MSVNSALVPILSLGIAACAVLATIVVVFLARRSETLRLQASLRTSAYVDFIRGVAGLAVLHNSMRDEEAFRELRKLTMLVADAKARIAIYGGAHAVKALAGFVRGGSVLDSPERARAFTIICEEFRNDGRPKLGKVSNTDMHVLLFGPDATHTRERKDAL
jgi:hypothetical protein